MITLRDYQQQAVADIRAAFKTGKRRVLFQLPTGGGKTTIFSYLVRALYDAGKYVAIIAHRDELLKQISDTLKSFEVPHSFIAAKKKFDKSQRVQVCGVHTLKRRTDKFYPDWIIIDEAHHAVAGSWATILGDWSLARVLGVTATPERLDGKGLGDIFEQIVNGPSVKTLIEQGHLARPKYYSPTTIDTSTFKTVAGEYNKADVRRAVDRPTITACAVTWYNKLCAGKPAVAFCASIQHSKNVAEQFNRYGFRWASLDSDMSDEERKAVVDGLRSGALHGISSCDIISEGFDIPFITAAILLRPTKSLGLFLQQVGRALRPAPDKPFALIIDHVGNIGKTYDGQWEKNHGFIEEERVWSLDGKEKQEGEPRDDKMCPACFMLVPAGTARCECGYEFAKEREPAVETEGDLIEVIPPDVDSIEAWIRSTNYRDLMRWAKTEEQLKKIAKVRGYKRTWVYYVSKSRNERKDHTNANSQHAWPPTRPSLIS
jgi:superfamily II DNA or RNA helicase